MKKLTEEANSSKAKAASALDDLIQQGARQIIQQAVEAELAGSKRSANPPLARWRWVG